MKILHVDEDSDLLDQAKNFLEKEDDKLNIETATSAEKGLELLEEDNYDAIVSGYKIPTMDGVEFLEAVREDMDSDIPFIFFSNEDGEEAAVVTLNLGADRYILREGDLKSQYETLAQAIVSQVNRHRPGKALKEAEQRFGALAENAPFSLFLYREKFLYVNPASEDIIGYSREELLGMNFWEIIAPEDQEMVKERGLARLSGEEPPSTYEFKILRKDGERRWILFTGVQVEYEGKPTGLGVAIDITDRKRAEEELKENERKYKNLFYETPLGIFRYNEEGIITECNEKFVDMIGSSKEDLVGLDLINDLEDEKMIEEIKSSLKEGEGRYEGDYTSVTAGKTTPVRVLLKGMRNDNGEIYAGIGLVEDVTERKEARRELEREKNRYEELFRDANELIVTTDPEGNIKRANKTAEEMTGYSEEEVKGENILSFAYEEDKEEFIEIWERVLEGEFEEMVVRIEAKDGEIRWMKAGGRPIMEDGEVVEIQYNGQDITDLKRTERRMRREKERFEELFEGANEGIFTTDKDGYVKRINQKTEELTGYSEEEYKGVNVLESAHPEDKDKFIEFWKRILSGEEPTYQVRIVTKGGETRHVVTGGRAIKEDGEIVEIQYNFKDITRRVESEERERFLHSLLRHDLRNKLSVIEGYSDLLRDYDFSEEQAELIEKIVDASEESMELIENVRTMRKIDLEDEIGEVSVKPLINDVVAENKSLADEKGMSIEKNLPTFESKARASDLLKELFTNLVVNSIQHSKGSKIRISGEELEDEIIVEVEDDGKGIPDEEKEGIFDRGTKFGATGGSGIGLHLVQEIAENYGGNVEVQDSELGGAKFNVHLQKAGD